MEKNRYDVPLDRFDHILAISSGTVVDSLDIQTDHVMVLKFSNYVKSQIHLSLQTLFGRDIYLYRCAYYYVQGEPMYEEQAKQVLSYFYEDIKYFLKNNKYNLFVDVEVDAPFTSMARRELVYREYAQKLVDLYEQSFNSFEQSLDYIRNHKTAIKIIDYFDRRSDIRHKLNSLIEIDMLLDFNGSRVIEWRYKQ